MSNTNELINTITSKIAAMSLREKIIILGGACIAAVLLVHLIFKPDFSNLFVAESASVEKAQQVARLKVIADFMPAHGSLEEMQQIALQAGIEGLRLETNTDTGMVILMGLAGNPDDIPAFLQEVSFIWFDLRVTPVDEGAGGTTNPSFKFVARKTIAAYAY